MPVNGKCCLGQISHAKQSAIFASSFTKHVGPGLLQENALTITGSQEFAADNDSDRKF